jgi:hypothetical protein
VLAAPGDGRTPLEPSPVVTYYSGSPHVREGIDFFIGRPKPGYTPYAYPHALNSKYSPLAGLLPRRSTFRAGSECRQKVAALIERRRL